MSTRSNYTSYAAPSNVGVISDISSDMREHRRRPPGVRCVCVCARARTWVAKERRDARNGDRFAGAHMANPHMDTLR